MKTDVFIFGRGPEAGVMKVLPADAGPADIIQQQKKSLLWMSARIAAWCQCNCPHRGKYLPIHPRDFSPDLDLALRGRWSGIVQGRFTGLVGVPPLTHAQWHMDDERDWQMVAERVMARLHAEGKLKPWEGRRHGHKDEASHV